MVILIIAVLVVIGICCSIGFGVDEKPFWGILCLAFMVLAIVGLIKANNDVCSILETQTTPLYAGHNASEISGSFMLGSGTIEEVDYVYYWVDSGGIKSKHKRRMNNSVFIEDGKNVMLQKANVCPENLKWLFIENGHYKIEFHVPEGSISQMYQYK